MFVSKYKLPSSRSTKAKNLTNLAISFTRLTKIPSSFSSYTWFHINLKSITPRISGAALQLPAARACVCPAWVVWGPGEKTPGYPIGTELRRLMDVGWQFSWLLNRKSSSGRGAHICRQLSRGTDRCTTTRAGSDICRQFPRCRNCRSSSGRGAHICRQLSRGTDRCTTTRAGSDICRQFPRCRNCRSSSGRGAHICRRLSGLLDCVRLSLY